MIAGAVWSEEELAAIRSVLPFPLRVVRLTLPFAQIEARLSSAVTAGRAKDLHGASSKDERLDLRIGDLVLANDRPIRDVADEIFDWLNWG